MKFKVYSSTMIAPAGHAYSVRYLLDPEELAGLQAAGLIADNTCEVVGLQEYADIIAADFERQTAMAMGGYLQ